MFQPITIPYGAKLLMHTLRLAPSRTFDDVELALAEMCAAVNANCGDAHGGFLAGQVFRRRGASGQGQDAPDRSRGDSGPDLLVVTFWRTFESHARACATAIVSEKLGALARHCAEVRELPYDLLWQCDARSAAASAHGCDLGEHLAATA